jgi:hypothetical protein
VNALYLDAATVVRVMRDGPALRVRVRDRADRLFPLRRIERIVNLGTVPWDTDALLAAADAGISVSFVGRDGALRATLNGDVRDCLIDLTLLFDFLLDRIDGAERYHRWVAAQAQLARLETVHAPGRGAATANPKNLDRIIAGRVRPHVVMKTWRRFTRQVHGIVRTACNSLLREHGLDTQHAVLRAARIDVANDLTAVLLWGLRNAMVSYARHCATRSRRHGDPRARLELRDAVHFVETHRDDIERRTHGLLRGLHEFLLDRGDSHAA